MNKQCANCTDKATRFIQSKAKYFCNKPECLSEYVNRLEHSQRFFKPSEPVNYVFTDDSFESRQRRLANESIRIIKHRYKKPRYEKKYDKPLTKEEWKRINAHMIRRMLRRTHFSNYYQYIESKEWKLKSKLIKRRDNYRCKICDDKHKIMAHHLTYKRKYCEHPSDLITLCGGCHDIIHCLEKNEGWKLHDAFIELCAMKNVDRDEVLKSLHVSWYDIRRPLKDEPDDENGLTEQVRDFEAGFRAAIELDN